MDQHSVSCLPTGPDITIPYYTNYILELQFSDNGYDIKVMYI